MFEASVSHIYALKLQATQLREPFQMLQTRISDINITVPESKLLKLRKPFQMLQVGVGESRAA